MSKIEAEVKKMAGAEDEEIDPLDFDNLDLADVEIGTFSPEDKVYLEKFERVDNMIMLGCQLTSLVNFPELPEVKRLELSENELNGSDLAHLKKLKGLICLNFGKNKIEKLSDLNQLKDLADLSNLDVRQNPVASVDDFQKKCFELLPNLEILNGFDKEGNEVSSDGFDFAEGEEEDMGENEYFAKIKANLTEEERKDIEDKGMTLAQYIDGQANDLNDFDSDDASGDDDEDSEDEGKATKRAKK